MWRVFGCNSCHTLFKVFKQEIPQCCKKNSLKEVLEERIVLDRRQLRLVSSSPQSQCFHSLLVKCPSWMAEDVQLGDLVSVTGKVVDEFYIDKSSEVSVHKFILASNISQKSVSFQFHLPPSFLSVEHSGESSWNWLENVLFSIATQFVPSGHLLNVKLSLLVSSILACCPSEERLHVLLAEDGGSSPVERVLQHIFEMVPVRRKCTSKQNLFPTMVSSKASGDSRELLTSGELVFASRGVCLLPRLEMFRPADRKKVFEAMDKEKKEVVLKGKAADSKKKEDSVVKVNTTVWSTVSSSPKEKDMEVFNNQPFYIYFMFAGAEY